MNYVENLKAAIAAVEAQPELDLSMYRSKHPCGTLFCVAGLLPETEHFIKLGVKAARRNGHPLLGGLALDETLDTLFGTYSGGAHAYQVLCATYGAGEWDDELLDQLPAGATDKDLALARLRKALDYQLLYADGDHDQGAQ